MQRVPNPVPRVVHPDWLHKKVAEREATHKQTKLDALFAHAREKKAAAMVPVIGDVEDLVLGGETRQGQMAVGIATTTTTIVDVTDENADMNRQQQQQHAAPTQDTAAAAVAKAPAADRRDSFTGWLASKKESWREARLRRKRRRETTGVNEETRRHRARLAAGVEGMFAQQAESLATAPWHIVSISPTAQPGVYKTWAVINQRMHAVPLRIPRELYVDTSLDPTAAATLLSADAGTGTEEGVMSLQLVRRTLPDGAEPHYTYQVVLSESYYRSHRSVLESKLANTAVYGVYEARVPPEWSAALSTGCVAVLSPSARGRLFGSGFDVNELCTRPVMEHGYFESSSHGSNEPSGLKHMTLHYSEDASRGRAVYALHLPLDAMVYMWVVNPATRGGQKEISPSSMEKTWIETRDALLAELLDQGDGGGGEDDDDGDSSKGLLRAAPPQCRVTYVRSREKAAKELQKVLVLRVRDRARGPSVLLLNAPDLQQLRHALPVLGDIPCCAMPLGNGSSADAYPALGWQTPAARTAVHRLLTAYRWLEMRIDAARYAHLPFSSIGADWVLDACDALFARQLRDQNHLLWTVDGAQPDLGGRPTDVADSLLINERPERLEVAWPGAYRCACLEIKVSHLAVCAVLEAHTICELEGAALVDDQATCGPAFRVLKNLAHSWVEDATRRSNM